MLFFDYPPHVIWGVTARIISSLVDRLPTEGLKGPGR